jgi:hypothetical protein
VCVFVGVGVCVCACVCACMGACVCFGTAAGRLHSVFVAPWRCGAPTHAPRARASTTAANTRVAGAPLRGRCTAHLDVDAWAMSSLVALQHGLGQRGHVDARVALACSLARAQACVCVFMRMRMARGRGVRMASPFGRTVCCAWRTKLLDSSTTAARTQTPVRTQIRAARTHSHTHTHTHCMACT